MYVDICLSLYPIKGIKDLWLNVPLFISIIPKIVSRTEYFYVNKYFSYNPTLEDVIARILYIEQNKTEKSDLLLDYMEEIMPI